MAVPRARSSPPVATPWWQRLSVAWTWPTDSSYKGRRSREVQASASFLAEGARALQPAARTKTPRTRLPPGTILLKVVEEKGHRRSPELKDPGAPHRRLQAGKKFKTFVPRNRIRTARKLSSAEQLTSTKQTSKCGEAVENSPDAVERGSFQAARVTRSDRSFRPGGDVRLQQGQNKGALQVTGLAGLNAADVKIYCLCDEWSQ